MTINHFIIWFIIGTIVPNKYVLALALGILWELFEQFVVFYKPLYAFVKKHWFVPEQYWNERPVNIITDLFVNLLGYYMGSKIR